MIMMMIDHVVVLLIILNFLNYVYVVAVVVVASSDFDSAAAVAPDFVDFVVYHIHCMDDKNHLYCLVHTVI